MKKFFLTGILFVIGFQGGLKAQDTLVTTGVDTDTAVFEPATEQGKNLDLAAVLEVFRESEGLEDFEKKLNQKDGINNLDLNGDSIVDYIRVLEKEEGEYRVVVLQSVLGKNEFQDVAFINIKRKSEDDIEVQAEGSRVIYGEDYYVSPEPTVHVSINLWPVWGYMYAPGYHYYRSPYYWGYYPPYWRPYPPFPYHYYHRRVYHYHHGYHYGHRVMVRRPPSVYAPRNSGVVHTTPARRPGNRPPQQGVKPGAPAQKPATRPSTRPATPPAQKPATRPSTRPTTPPAQKPATRPSTRPATPPVQKPATRPSTRPSTPQRRPAARPATPPRQRPAARPPARMPRRR
jgi:hypothetical protein